MRTTPAQLRDEALEEFRATAAAYFDKHPELRSVALCVSQYWNDEADDAVHGDLVFSTASAPTWPHHCDDDDAGWDPTGSAAAKPVEGDACCSCHPAFYDSYLRRWDSNGRMVEAFAGYCKEGSDQGMTLGESALPYAIARRSVTGAVEIEVVGQLLRPWMDSATALEAIAQANVDDEVAALLELVYATPDEDGPRHVLADFLQELGDPRGEFIALDLSGAGSEARAALLEQHRADWLGALRAVAALDSADFSRGFPTALRVCFVSADAVRRCGDDAAWSTVESIEFFDPNVGREEGYSRQPLGSIQHLSARMSSLRTLIGVETSGLERLREIDFSLPVTRLQTTIHDEHDLELLLGVTSLPSLEAITITTGLGYTPRDDLMQVLAKQASWRQLPSSIEVATDLNSAAPLRVHPVDSRMKLSVRGRGSPFVLTPDGEGRLTRAHGHVTAPPEWTGEVAGQDVLDAVQRLTNLYELRLSYADAVVVEPRVLDAIEGVLLARNPNAVFER